MEMNFNSEMLVLAREYRELTQDELAKKSGVSRIKIAKIESGIVSPSDQEESESAKRFQASAEAYTVRRKRFTYLSHSYVFPSSISFPNCHYPAHSFHLSVFELLNIAFYSFTSLPLT